MKMDSLGMRPAKAAFTLVELLSVIGIIAILAGLLLVVVPSAIKQGKTREAEIQMNAIAAAIESYDADYGHFPVSQAAQAAARPDVTYGATFRTPTTPVAVGTLVGSVLLPNSDITAVLMNFTNFPNTTTATVNLNGQKNTKAIAYLNAKLTGDTSSPGVGTDLVYRDPWGNPYVISLDLNDDGLCEDAYYKSASVSTGGLNGLILQPDGNYAFHGKIMVWSAGPDGKINPSQPANQGENKDNILTWR